jgi:hypothetical protein
MSVLRGGWLIRGIKRRHDRNRSRRGAKKRRTERRPVLEKFEDRTAAGSVLLALPGLLPLGDTEFEPFKDQLAADPLAILRRRVPNPHQSADEAPQATHQRPRTDDGQRTVAARPEHRTRNTPPPWPKWQPTNRCAAAVVERGPVGRCGG